MKKEKIHYTFNPQPIKDFMTKNHLSQKKMAELCQISIGSLKKLLSGQLDLSVCIVEKFLL